MRNINWIEEVDKCKDQLIADTKELLKIKSVLNEETKTESAPFGTGIAEALAFLLQDGEKNGLYTKNVNGYAGHLEMGEGHDVIGILCHIDVVPEGDGWSSHPFGADERDGKIYARGAIDDKGPTMAAYYAMKIVKELGVPISKRVRLIIGTDEESNWRGVDHYFKHEEMPAMGFAPDADFPIIYAEKGICDFELQFQQNDVQGQADDIELLEFKAGHRLNMVPDYATCTLLSLTKTHKIKQEFTRFLDDSNLNGDMEEIGEKVILRLEGKSAHGMEPKNGVNAGLKLMDFLGEILQMRHNRSFVSFITYYLCNDSRGDSLQVAFRDHELGELTINVGTIEFTRESGGKIGINLRYPVSLPIDDCIAVIKQKAEAYGGQWRKIEHLPPHHVEEDHELVQTLKRVYEEQTGDKGELLAIGGGTYARSLKAGVAFGPLFPGSEDVAHQKDEYIEISQLLRATAIYAQAIYELAK